MEYHALVIDNDQESIDAVSDILDSLGHTHDLAKTQQEAMMLSYFTMLPTVFLSGFFFPLAAMPPVLQWISHIIPLRYYLIIIRSVLLKGVGAAALTDEIIAMVIFAVVLMGGAALRFRKRLD